MRDPDKLVELAEKLGRPLEHYLKWRQVCDRYERGKNTKLAQVIGALRRNGEKESHGQLQARAYAHSDYVDFLNEWDKAEQNKVKAQVEYESLKTNFEALQSAIAYDREAMKRLG